MLETWVRDVERVKKVKDELLFLARALEKEQDSSYIKGCVSGLKEAIRILERNFWEVRD